MNPELIGDDRDPSHFQHGWQFHATRHVHEQDKINLLSQLTPDRQALLRSQSGTGAGAWLLVVPSSDWLSLDDFLFLLALRRRLFLPLPLATNACQACGAQVDEWG